MTKAATSSLQAEPCNASVNSASSPVLPNFNPNLAQLTLANSPRISGRRPLLSDLSPSKDKLRYTPLHPFRKPPRCQVREVASQLSSDRSGWQLPFGIDATANTEPAIQEAQDSTDTSPFSLSKGGSTKSVCVVRSLAPSPCRRCFRAIGRCIFGHLSVSATALSSGRPILVECS